MIYLGYIVEVSDRTARGRIAQLRPLCSAETASTFWNQVYRDSELASEFPNRGLVTWFSPYEYVQEGSVWVYSIREQPTFDETNPTHDRFRVEGDPSSAVEIISPGGGQNEIEYSCTELGLMLPFTPSRTLYLATDQDNIIGPFTLSPTNVRNEWKLVGDTLNKSIWMYEAVNENNVLELKIAGHARTFAGPKFQLPKKLKELDWSPPEVLLKRLFKHLRERDRDLYDNLELTNKVIEYIIESLAAKSVSVASARLIEQRCERGLRILETIQRSDSVLKDLQEDLLAIPEISGEIESVMERKTVELENQIKAKLAELSDKAIALESKKLDLTNQCAELEGKIKKKEQQLKKELSLIDEAIIQKAKMIGAKPEKFLADELFSQPLVKFLLSGVPNSNGNAIGIGSSKIEYGWTKRETKIIDYSSALKTYKKRCRLFSVNGSIMNIINATLCSGMIPLLSGDNSYDVLSAFSNVVTGGRKCWAVVDPTVLTPKGFLSLTDWSNFSSDQNSTIESFLSETSETDQSAILIVDGINHSPLDCFLYPFIQQNYGSVRERNVGKPNSLSWSSQVRLAMIVRSESIFDLPSWIWKYCCYIPVDDFRLTTKSIDASEQEKVLYYELENWISPSLDEKLDDEVTMVEEISTSLVERYISRPKLAATFRFMRSLLHCGMDSEEARTYTIAYCLLPELSHSASLSKQDLEDEFGLSREIVSKILTPSARR